VCFAREVKNPRTAIFGDPYNGGRQLIGMCVWYGGVRPPPPPLFHFWTNFGKIFKKNFRRAEGAGSDLMPNSLFLDQISLILPWFFLPGMLLPPNWAPPIQKRGVAECKNNSGDFGAYFFCFGAIAGLVSCDGLPSVFFDGCPSTFFVVFFLTVCHLVFFWRLGWVRGPLLCQLHSPFHHGPRPTVDTLCPAWGSFEREGWGC
jgi:hypothetical protein